MNNLHDKYSQINDNVETSISMQQISMDQQDKLHAMQHEFSKDMATNNENLQTFLDESNEKQLKILSKQDDAFETISNIRSKTDELHKETENIQNEMSAMYESQRENIHSAKEEIASLTKDSRDAYAQIMAMMNEALFALNAIYKMDVQMLRQFVCIQSCAFYSFWILFSYFLTIPNAVRSSRLWLFVGIASCVLLEKNVNWFEPLDFYEFDDLNLTIRKVMFCLNVSVYVVFALTYKDPIIEQTELLKNIDEKMRRRAPRIVTKRISFMSALSSITPKNVRRAMNF